MLLLLLPNPSLAVQTDSHNQAENRTILVLGDSLSAGYGIGEAAGWVRLLQQKLHTEQYDYHVVNASVSGETTTGGLRRLDSLLAKWQPELVVIELGGNDGLRGVNLNTIKHNLSRMIAQAQSTAADVILLGMHIPPNYGPRYTDGFHRIYHTLAEEYSISLVPFLLHNVATDSELMQTDGIHPTAEAQPTILETVWPVLAARLVSRESAIPVQD